MAESCFTWAFDENFISRQARATSDFINLSNGEFLCKALYTLSPYKINLKKWIWKTQIYRKIDWSHTKIFPLKWIWTLSSSFAVSVLGCKHQAKRNWKFFSASWKNFCQSSFTVKIFERPVSFMQYENIYVKAYIFLKDQIWKTFYISAVVKPQNQCVQYSTNRCKMTFLGFLMT